MAASSFTSAFEALNGLPAGRVAAWVGEAGMQFASTDSWWGRRRPRPQPHEGLDLASYRSPDGVRTALDGRCLWPTPWPGTVRAVFDDFLGRSVFVEHDHTDGHGRRRCSVFGHTTPLPHIEAGLRVSTGAALGRVADTAGRVTAAHLHWTLGWCSGPPGSDLFDWPALAANPRFEFLDPSPHLGVPVEDASGAALA